MRKTLIITALAFALGLAACGPRSESPKAQQDEMERIQQNSPDIKEP